MITSTMVYTKYDPTRSNTNNFWNAEVIGLYVNFLGA